MNALTKNNKPQKPRNSFVMFLGDLRHPSTEDVFTTSRHIAKKFGKRHDHIISKIEKFVDKEFNRLNFREVTYIDKKGEARKMYNITQDGAMFLIMSFNGAKAEALKIEFINRFNAMYDWIQKMLIYQSTIDLTVALTDAIQKAVGDLEVESLYGYQTNIYAWTNMELNLHIAGITSKEQALKKYPQAHKSLGIREIIRRYDEELNDIYVGVENLLIKRILPKVTPENIQEKVTDAILGYLDLF